MALDIVLLGLIRPKVFRGRWVFVNAWSVYDPRGEAAPGEYIRNRYHWVACAVDHAATVADVVFAAGNCGAFCPDGRCAQDVIGPGRSILGANSLDSVLTVGAARSDGIWAGYSSQGPGQFPEYGGPPQQKPDVAAPAHFRMLDTAHRLAGGSSAASAVAAGRRGGAAHTLERHRRAIRCVVRTAARRRLAARWQHRMEQSLRPWRDELRGCAGGPGRCCPHRDARHSHARRAAGRRSLPPVAPGRRRDGGRPCARSRIPSSRIWCGCAPP